MKKYLTLEMIGWFLAGIVAFMLGGSAFSKIVATPEMVGNFEFMKLTPYLLWVGIAELVALVLLLIPRTSHYGAILITSLMSAAAVMHLSAMGAAKVEYPIIIGVLTWVSYGLRGHKFPHHRKKTNS